MDPFYNRTSSCVCSCIHVRVCVCVCTVKRSKISVYKESTKSTKTWVLT